jgi:hypothetical protein
MALVIDASVVAAWAFEEEHPTAESPFARARAEQAFVPYYGGTNYETFWYSASTADD